MRSTGSPVASGRRRALAGADRLAAQADLAARPSPAPAMRASAPAVGRTSTTRPSRMIVSSSVAAITSASLWLTSATAFLSRSTTMRSASKRNVASDGESTDVGSSKTSTSGSRRRHLMISTRWRMPADSSLMRASGSISSPYCSLISATRSRMWRGSNCADVAERDVLPHGERFDEREVLVHHADAVGSGVDRILDLDRLAVTAHLAGSRG